MIEIVVALTVFGIALAGLLPLLAIMSRHLHPIITDRGGATTYRSTSPARDGNINGDLFLPPPYFEQHVWYVTPYADPWIRKLGAGAQLYQITQNSTTEPTPFSALTTSMASMDKTTTAEMKYDSISMDFFPEGQQWPFYPAVDPTCRRIASEPNTTPPGFKKWILWPLTAPADGWYSVQASWPGDLAQANDAVFGLETGSPPTFVPCKVVDQTANPDDVEDENGKWWKQITVIYLTKGQVITVALTNVRNGPAATGEPVAADTVRIVPNKAIIQSVQRSWGRANNNIYGKDVTAELQVQVNLLQ